MNKCYLSPFLDIKTSTKRAHSFKPDSLSHDEIIDILDVENNPRYKPTKTATYCNIAAHDFATLYGAYIPRVWWTNLAIKRGDDKAEYGKNCYELNANSLHDWFLQFGGFFGWKIVDAESAQKIVNGGGFAVIVARNKIRSKSGHITVVIPGPVMPPPWPPTQWQAGRTNKENFHEKWWESKIYDSFYIFAICE